MLQDMHYAIRSFLKNPGLSALSITTLALGIGTSTVIFSVVDSVLLRPLPYKNADEIVMVWNSNTKLGVKMVPVSYPDFQDWTKLNHVFAGMAASAAQSFNLTDGNQPERIDGMRITSSLLDFLGVEPVLGRSFLPEEQQPGRDHVVIISYGLWQSRFAGSEAVIGKSLILNSESYIIVGVLPARFQAPPGWAMSTAEVYVPLSANAQRGVHYLRVMARLQASATLAEAQAEMAAIASQLAKQYSDTNSDQGISLVPMKEQVVGNARPGILILMGAISFMLLSACANVANFLLAQGAVRYREMAIRAALGATRWRLVRQLLTETTLLAALGASGGLLLSFWGVHLLSIIIPDNLPRAKEINLHGAGLGFTLFVSVLSGLIFGLALSLQLSKPKLNEALNSGSNAATVVPHGNLIRSSLVVLEVGLAVVLLVAAGLMIKSFVKLQKVDPGFNPENVITMAISLPRYKYPQTKQQAGFFQLVLDRIGALPGVDSVAVINSLPLSSTEQTRTISISGYSRTLSDLESSPGYRTISPYYFRLMGIPLLKGRVFTDKDNDSAAGVAIINETMARHFWPYDDPIGRQLTIAPEQVPREIIGIVGDVNHSGLEEKRNPEVFVPYIQRGERDMFLLAHTATEPNTVVRAIRSEIVGIDKDQPVYNVTMMKDRLSGYLAPRRFPTVLLSVFSTVSLVLAASGIYGVMSSSVVKRTHDIGIRVAVGARPRDILTLVIRQGMALVLLGLIAGLAGALLLRRLLESLLFSVSTTDPAIFTVVPGVMLVVALLAIYIPAHSAATVDPMVPLRYE